MNSTHSAVDIISVPYDSGRRGYRMGAGPDALLQRGLVDRLRSGGCDVANIAVETADNQPPFDSAADLARRIAGFAAAARARARFPLVLAGNCISTIGGLAGTGARNVVWFDAHGDLNTPATSPSGFLDGMAAAVVLGWCHSALTADLAGFSPIGRGSLMLIGSRDLDPGERHAVEAASIPVVPRDAARNPALLANALEMFARDASEVYLHLDLDVLDAIEVGPANSYAGGNGLTIEDVTAVIRAIGSRRRIAGATISAYDPSFDETRAVSDAAFALIHEILSAASAQQVSS